MPGTTRYSATFDRPYEEEEKTAPDPAATNGTRRSRSHSLQANVGMDIRPYTPLGINRTSQRSSSTDSGGSKGAENIPTRMSSKPVVKTHNNPFQFVKVGTCPLYRKAEEQLKKVKEVKKPEVLKEEEEEWQSNLDSWKSRRRKMSEDIFKRQEEIRQFETEEQSLQAVSKKTKTFSEMVESRAHRGRTMSLCLISSPLELQQWEIENNKSNPRNLFSEGSEENSAVNSEDEGLSDRRIFQKNVNGSSKCTNGNGLPTSKNGSAKNKVSKLFELGENCSPLKDGIYIDSGLESISSSHRTGDTPDSCSDFSQDSGSSIDCDSPRASGLLLHGVNLLEEYNNSKPLHHSDSSDSFSNIKPAVPEAPKQNITENSNGSSLSNGEENCLLQEAQTLSSINGSNSKPEMSRKNGNSTESCTSELSTDGELENAVQKQSKTERSVESENEVFVDFFEELNSNVCSAGNLKEGITSGDSVEAPHKDTSDCSNSALPRSTNPASLEESVTNALSTTDIGELSSLKAKDNIDLVAKNPVLKSQKSNEMLPFSEVSTSMKSEPHSQEKEKNPVLNQKETNKKLRKKKKATAKIVSVEISNQKVNSSSDSNKTCLENSQLGEESLNVVFQSQPSNGDSPKNTTNDSKVDSSAPKGKVTLNDVLPVEQIAEEMEKLILQQLEEEERAKELSSKAQPIPAFESPDRNHTAPPRKAEPPKEKPPPPPKAEKEVQKVSESKTPSLKRVNSTKRIKKEIHKRRSNFLGIENTDEALVCGESLVPPPNALEQILKAEMELDRESMKRLENAAAERLKFEEKEIIEKEREIIANVETEEMQKHLVNNEELCDKSGEDRIHKLKEERKRIESERVLADTQRLRLEEEKQLREREEYIRKQEEDNASSAELSSSLLSDAANLSNVKKSPNASSLCTETKSNISLSEIGEGNTVSNSASKGIDSTEEKPTAALKPAVPPKPVKKKEAIRKERERLRQEQEALQRDREEHRLKLIREKELSKSPQKSNAPVSRLGPVPPAKPSFTPKLTNSISTQPNARENVIFTSQSYHGAQNGISSSSSGCVEPLYPIVNKHKPVPSQKKIAQNDIRGQQKMPLPKKQTPESSPESKYNQNHWLIQEAEMRRIAELKERQHSAQFPISQTHLAEDEVCSNSRVPVLSPVIAPNQDKLRSYAHPSVVLQKYPPPVSSDKPGGIYQRAPQPPTKPSRVVPLERPEQMLSVSGRKRCSHCNDELGRGAAMIIESLQLYYHIQCFQCCVCQAQLGNGSCGTDVRVRNNKLHCHNCYSNDEAGLKFSQV